MIELNVPFLIRTFQKLQYLKDQAEVIKLFGEKSQNVWKNVIIIAKQGKPQSHDLNFQVMQKEERVVQ